MDKQKQIINEIKRKRYDYDDLSEHELDRNTVCELSKDIKDTNYDNINSCPCNFDCMNEFEELCDTYGDDADCVECWRKVLEEE